MEGFDVGDAAFGITPAVYPSATWNDVMSYCSNQWLSDYTYNGMYSYMIGHPSLAASTQSVQVAATGDFLSVAGVINPAENTAGFASLRRLTSVANPPALTPGGYSIRLLNAQNAQLADYGFTPNPSEESATLGFDQVVNFVAGTRTIQLCAPATTRCWPARPSARTRQPSAMLRCKARQTRFPAWSRWAGPLATLMATR